MGLAIPVTAVQDAADAFSRVLSQSGDDSGQHCPTLESR